MREVKAYVRQKMLEPVMRALNGPGVRHIVVSDVRSFGSGLDPKQWRLSIDAGAQYTENAKLEFVCGEQDVDRLVAIIEARARTGESGDGVIFVSPIERAVKIKTGEEDLAAIA